MQTVNYPHPVLKNIDTNIIQQGHQLREIGNLIIFDLSGDSNKTTRQSIMSALKGVKVPIAKSGINALEDEIFNWIKATYPGANVTDRFKPVLSIKS